MSLTPFIVATSTVHPETDQPQKMVATVKTRHPIGPVPPKIQLSGSADPYHPGGRFDDLFGYLAEKALLALDVHVPLLHFATEKRGYDAFQMVLNELMLWEPMEVYQLRMSALQDAAVVPERGRDVQFLVPEPCSHWTMMTLCLHCNQGHLQIRYEHKFNYDAELEDFVLFTASQPQGSHGESLLWVRCRSIQVLDTFPPQHEPLKVVRQTLPAILLDEQEPRIMLSFCNRFVLRKSSNIQEIITNMLVTNATLHLSFDKELWIMNIVDFFGTEPEEMVYPRVTNRYTKLTVDFKDTSVDVRTAMSPHVAVLCVYSAVISSTIVPSSPAALWNFLFHKTNLMLCESESAIAQTSINYALTQDASDISNFWKSQNYETMLSFSDFELALGFNGAQSRPSTEISIKSQRIMLDACADSFMPLIGFLVNFFDSIHGSEKDEQSQHSSSSVAVGASPVTDVFLDMDENAFKSSAHQLRDFSSNVEESSVAPPKIENLKIVDDYYAPAGKAESVDDFAEDEDLYREIKSRQFKLERKDVPKQAGDDVTVRTMGETNFEIIEDHFSLIEPAPVSEM